MQIVNAEGEEAAGTRGHKGAWKYSTNRVHESGPATRMTSARVNSSPLLASSKRSIDSFKFWGLYEIPHRTWRVTLAKHEQVGTQGCRTGFWTTGCGEAPGV